MRCPWCVHANERSLVFTGPRSWSTPDIPPDPDRTYWDEDGIAHTHSEDRKPAAYYCSNGHEWTGAHKPCANCGHREQPDPVLTAIQCPGTGQPIGRPPDRNYGSAIVPGMATCPHCGTTNLGYSHSRGVYKVGQHSIPPPDDGTIPLTLPHID